MSKPSVITPQIIRQLESRLTTEQVTLARIRYARYLDACRRFDVPSRAMGQRGFAYIEALEEAGRGDSVEMLAPIRGDERDYERRDFSGHYDW